MTLFISQYFNYTAGYLTWLFRAGSLVASAITTMPTWTKFDPLPILARSKDERRRQAAKVRRGLEAEDREDEGVASLFGDADGARPGDDPEGLRS